MVASRSNRRVCKGLMNVDDVKEVCFECFDRTKTTNVCYQ